MKPKILVVDDESLVHGSFLLSIRGSIIEEKAEFEFASSCEEALEKIKTDPFNYCLAFIDYQFSENQKIHTVGHLLAQEIKSINPCISTVMMSGDESKEALKNWLGPGVDKFLYKPLSGDTIRTMSESAIESYNANLYDEQAKRFATQEQKLVGLAGKSENIKQVSKLAIRYASSDQPALILGETGTGKELIAKAIHANSKRASKPFVVVNCAAITKSLFESELFGHVKGAFTDAKIERLGYIRQADKGVLFLDEIHHLSLEQQASLLRVLQEKTVQPVGGKNSVPVDFRLVAAGKPNLRKLSEKGEFLPDLYFRIKHLDVTILPLRERPEDILPTIAYVQNKIEQRTQQTKRILKPTLDKLVSYSWPGNVRELISEIERLYVVVDKPIVKESDLPKHILEQKNFSFYRANDEDLIRLDELEAMQKNQEMALIIQAMKLSDYNVAKAGRILGVNRTTLSSKLKSYGLLGKRGSMMDLILKNLLGGRMEGQVYEEENNHRIVSFNNI